MAVLTKEPLTCIHFPMRFLCICKGTPVKNDLADELNQAQVIIGCGRLQFAQYNPRLNESHLCYSFILSIFIGF